MAALRWVTALLLCAGASAIYSWKIFDKRSTETWIDGVCNPVNSSNDNITSNEDYIRCRKEAETCFNKVKRARSSSMPLSLQDRCSQNRKHFDICAEEAQLNATWQTITGSDRTCASSFLRGRMPAFPKGLKRPRRQILERGWRKRNWPFNIAFDYLHENNKIDDFKLRRYNRRNRRYRRNSPGFGINSDPDRVLAFIEEIEETNPDAVRNYTRCILRQEGLLTENNTVDRPQFESWASEAFATNLAIADAVTAAIRDCEEPHEYQLSAFMQCWGAACATAAL